MTLHQWDQFQNTGKQRGQYQQAGMGAFTLCESCNSRTGDWYATEYVRWARQAVIFLQNSPHRDQFVQISIANCYPLRFLKQAITMFFSVNDSEIFLQRHPELSRFVLNPESTGLAPEYDVYCSLYRGPIARHSGISTVYTIGRGTEVLTEIAHVPFALLLVFNAPYDASLTRISHFANYRFDEKCDIVLELFIGEGHTPFPKDFRTKKQVENEAEMSLRSNPAIS